MEWLELLYEDQHLVAVDKPAWWVVHPSRGTGDAPAVVHVLKKQLAQPVFPVHRIDRQASGVLVLARSSEVASVLGAHIREGRWRKSYLCLCRGVISEGLRVDHPVPEGKIRRPAQTLVDPVAVYVNRYTLVRAEPLTGRRHQIRYHLKHLSHPLVGDVNYGQGKINRLFRSSFGLHRMFLHADSLQLLHPEQDRELQVSCPLAPELKRVLEQLEQGEPEQGV